LFVQREQSHFLGWGLRCFWYGGRELAQAVTRNNPVRIIDIKMIRPGTVFIFDDENAMF